MRLLTSLLQGILTREASRSRWAFHYATMQPRETQRELLFSQLRDRAETGFGRDHQFSSIRTVEDFRRQVPITSYDYAKPYIERVMQGDPGALFNGEKLLMFTMTSGTTGKRKFIPVTKKYLDDYRRMWHVWGLYAYETHPELFLKKKMAFMGDWEEMRSPSNIPCGNMSGLTAKMQSRLVQSSYCLPLQSAKVSDIDAKLYLAWRIGVMSDVGTWMAPTPSILVTLARHGTTCADELIRDVRDGTLSARYDYPPALRKMVSKRLRADPQNAHRLETILSETGELLPQRVWPNLGLIATWLGGTFRTYLRFFPEYFGDAAVRDIGVIASEGRFTLPIEDGTPAGILEIGSTYFEFVPVGEIDAASPTILEAHELQEGGEYYLLLTTTSGLYRYNIFDVVKCVGWYQSTPLLEFLHKGSHVVDLAGEKLTEHQVVTAVDRALEAQGMTLKTYTISPRRDAERPYFTLFAEQDEFAGEAAVQALGWAVDRELQRVNLRYESYRTMKVIDPLHMKLLPPGAWQDWDRRQMEAAGGPAQQYKHPCLVADERFEDQFPSATTVVLSPAETPQ